MYGHTGCQRCGTEPVKGQYRASLAVRLVYVAFAALPFLGWVFIHLHKAGEPVGPVMVAALAPAVAVASIASSVIASSRYPTG